ncbi:hypothetical protein SCA6_012525 [Theobroma cacao]
MVGVATTSAAATVTTAASFSNSATSAMDSPLRTKVCIIGSGPAAHTAAIYTARAELKPILFEGWMANDIAPGGQLPPQPTSRTSLDSQTASWAWSLWTAAAINSSALAPPSTLKPSTRLTFLRLRSGSSPIRKPSWLTR